MRRRIAFIFTLPVLLAAALILTAPRPTQHSSKQQAAHEGRGR
jgi:hypothetical protein